MVYDASQDSDVGWTNVVYGAPTLLFLLLNASALHQFAYRFWRLQIWLHRLSERFRHYGGDKPTSVGGLAVDADGFDSANHYHAAGQEAPRVRLALAPIMAFGVVMLMVAPGLLLLAWGATLYFNQQRLLLAIAIVLMAACVLTLYYAVQYWHSGGWRMTSHILTLFIVSMGCYFLLAFVLSFLSSGVSFFGVSCHFLALNYILLTELLCQQEAQRQIPAQTILQADQFVSGGAGAPVGVQAQRLSKAEKATMAREAEKRFFEKFKAEHDLAAAGVVPAGGEGGEAASPTAGLGGGDSDEDVPSDGEDERALAAEDAAASGALLVNISAAKVSAQFSDVLHGLIHEQQDAAADRERQKQAKLYLASLAVLLAYSLMVYYNTDGPSAGADSATTTTTVTDANGITSTVTVQQERGDSRYLGFVVSGILVVWDALMYAYASYSGRVLDERTKVLVLAGSRVALVAFGFQGWFLGVCCLYAAAGFYLSYRIIDRRLPWAAFGELSGLLAGAECQRFSTFCATLRNPDADAGGLQAGSGSNALLRTMSRSGRGGLGIGEFVLLVLSVLFFMALCVSYRAGPDAAPPQSLSDFTSAPWQQYEIGVCVWGGVALWFLSVWTIRYWMTRAWRVTWQACVLTAVTQAAFTLAAGILFHRTESVILLVCLVCGPLFVLSLLGTYAHCVDVDWRLLRPSHQRNPPGLPFPLAVLTCGLTRDDYRMLANIVLTCGMMCVIGLSITLGLHGSSIGWSLTFILFILLTSVVPLVKYLQTLTLDTMDAVLLLLWLAAHISFFSLQYYVNGDSMTPRESFALWGSCVGYPTVLANVLSYHLFRQNGRAMTKHTAMVFTLTFVLVVCVVIIIFFTLGTAVGGAILAFVAAALAMGALFVRWVAGSYTLSRPLRVISSTAFVLLLALGVALGVALPEDSGLAFWAYSASWFLLILFVVVLAWGDRTRLAAGAGSAARASENFRYSDYVFPVFYFDRRNDSNPVKSANRHMALYCFAFLLAFAWCAACMVTERVNLGLGLSALTLLSFYTFARARTLSANKALMRIVTHIDEGTVARAREAARECQLAGASLLFDDPQPAIFGLKRWGLILLEMLLLGLDPQPVLKRKQAALKRKLGLGRSCFCTPLDTSAQQLDDHLLLLERLNEWSFACARVSFALEAHFYFLLQAGASAAVANEEAQMKAFVAWVRREKRAPAPSLQPVEIDPCITNYDIYDAPLHWSQQRILQVQGWKAEYLQSLADAANTNEDNRRLEAEAARVRERRMEEREKAQAERAKQREAEEAAADAAAAAAGQSVGVSISGAAAPAPGSAEALKEADPTVRQFRRIVAEFKKTGKQWEDPDFEPSDHSLYLAGERDTSKKSAVNGTPIDDWRRPNQILADLHAQDPSISPTPKLFVDGFDLTDIVQGSIGTCYFLSAIGCLGLREQAQPRHPLLSDMFEMEAPGAEYNTCGAFLVRFYRSGRVHYVLIDDRIPCQAGNFAFSKSKVINELWVALVEKAYAKLFTCFEAIEAGNISQALCDLSNGASEQIALKDASGSVCVDAAQLWVQLQDSVASGYLIGAGSNSGADSDFVNGIAQGHAYMVVRLFADANQETRLIQLQNPHGHGEWDGDWCDSDEVHWKQWWRNTLWDKGQTGEKDDGKFWMSFTDFLQSYANVYICRLLPVRQSLAGAWRGRSAAGPSTPFHNPHFVVSAPQPTKVWVELEQRSMRGRKKAPAEGEAALPASEMSDFQLTEAQQAEYSPNGYAFIIFVVLENGGTRVEKLSKDSVKLAANKWKMLNERQIGAELFLDQPDTPYTIVPMCKHKGWETDFTLSVFSADDSVKFSIVPPAP